MAVDGKIIFAFAESGTFSECPEFFDKTCTVNCTVSYNCLALFGLRRNVKAKAPLRVQLFLTFGGEGEEQEASALISKKKGRREGSKESLQKFDFFIMILRLS